jgi:tRNA threonylcarbamoyladenosine biosynthesis protein TsaB
MKILAVETSGQVCGTALLEDDRIVAEYNVQYKKTHSQSLVPMMDEIRTMTELDLKTVDAVALTEGPGSFTGIRIGAATAKGLGLALNIPLIPVPTVDALAYNLSGTDGSVICPILDARRGQVYTGIYESVYAAGATETAHAAEPADMEAGPAAGSAPGTNERICRQQTLLEQCLVTIDEIAGKLNEIGKPVIFLGDGVPVCREKIAEIMKVPYSFAPVHLCQAACLFGGGAGHAVLP